MFENNLNEKNFLSNNDPVKYAYKLYDLYKSYIKKSKFKIFDKCRRYYLLHVKYTKLLYDIEKLQKNIAEYLFNNPNMLILILNRFIIFIITICKLFNKSFDEMLNETNLTNTIDLEVYSEEYKDGIKMNNYNLIIRSSIPFLLNNSINKFTISKVNINLDKYEFNIKQTIYDSEDSTNYNIKKILHYRNYELDMYGNLINLDYTYNNKLNDNEIFYFKYIIMHIMNGIFILFDRASQLNFSEV